MVRILYIAASPLDDAPLDLDRELRAIDDGIQRAIHRDEVSVQAAFSVRRSELVNTFERYRPNIIHFGGHGNELGQLTFETAAGKSAPVAVEALTEILRILAPEFGLRCVVLNACFSNVQAEALATHVDCCIGMSRPVGNAEAIEFASQFYSGIANGRSVRTAFDLACQRLAPSSNVTTSAARLFARQGVDPGEVRFLPTSSTIGPHAARAILVNDGLVPYSGEAGARGVTASESGARGGSGNENSGLPLVDSARPSALKRRAAAVFVPLSLMAVLGVGVGLRSWWATDSLADTRVIAAGVARLGSDADTARKLYGACVATDGPSCGGTFEGSAFVRQVGWSKDLAMPSFRLDAHEVKRGDFAEWLESSRGRLATEPGPANVVWIRDEVGVLLAIVGQSPGGPSGVGFSDGHYRAEAAGQSKPATHVSWYGAGAFCTQRGKRLPTEAEWEFAARGPRGQVYPWGNQAPPSTGVAYATHPCGDQGCAPVAVGLSALDRTPEGIFDMAGNVSEWTMSPFPGEGPEERARCLEHRCRVVRGGNYRDSAPWLQAAVRSRFEAEQVLDNVGFRCAKDG